ncbi:DUF6232 family protein [Actinoplanes sp. NPDC051851]|uniref:DUF6232 family protein n=1 Tax=Actinoplanes sp. NPDC051851 TaxID=3154753 RepID=UPI00343DE9FE
MFVYYEGPRALITLDFFEDVGGGRRRFAVGDLHTVRIVRQHPEGDGNRPVLGVSALAVAVATVPLIGPVSRALAGVVVSALLVQAGWCLRPRLVRWDLVAVYHYRPAILFSSYDQREFDQVCRGLRRCIEHRRSLGF